METLKEIIANEPSTSYRRVEALRGLIQLARTDREVFDYVLSLSNDESIPFRLKWARLLSRMDSPQIAQKFAESLEEETNNHVLKTLIKGIAKNGDKSFVNLLEPYLEHESYAIKHAAKMTIAELLYEPAPVKQEEKTEETPIKPSFPRHKLPWRLKLKFFWRKYKLVLFVITALLLLFPLSLGVGYAIHSVKELIESYQPTAEELAERKRIEEEKKRLEEELARQKELERQRQLAEQERLKAELARQKELEKQEELKNKKPINWGQYLMSALIVIVLSSLAYGLSRFMQLLDRRELDDAQKKFKGSLKDSRKSEKPKSPIDKKIPKESELEKKAPGRKVETHDDIRKRVQGERKEKTPEAVRAEKVYQKKVVSQAKEMLFSFFDRVFRLFNNNYSKTVLKIFIPNDLFYWIRFRTMLVSLQVIFSWAFLAALAMCIYLLFSGSFSKSNFIDLTIPLIKPGIPIILITMVFGFFFVNPFKQAGINLYKIMSDYYYRRKYYFRTGEQEQWSILLRNIKDSARASNFSLIHFLVKKVIIILALTAFVYLIYIPLIKRIQPDAVLEVPSFDFAQLKSKLTETDWSSFDLALACILLFPWIGFVAASLFRTAKESTDAEKKSLFTKEDELSQKVKLSDTYKSIYTQTPGNQEESLKVIVGEGKEEWMKSEMETFQKTFPDFKIAVRYQDDDQALRNSRLETECDVWMPDNKLKALRAYQYRFEAQEAYLKNDGCLLRTPLVYIFRKKVLKEFLKIYKNVNYRSLSDAQGTIRNITGSSFSFSQPDFTDLSTGTAALMLMVNEYFRTTLGVSEEELKNKVFVRSVHEYMAKIKLSDKPFESDAFTTTEQEAIQLLSGKKKRFWTVVYPGMSLFMDHPFLIMNHTVNTVFLFSYLSSISVQRRLSQYGWRPGAISSFEENPESFKAWEKLNIRSSLGVSTQMPVFNHVEMIISIAQDELSIN